MEPNKLIKLLRELKRDDVMVVLTDEAIDSLIDIVEKYQKIQEVMDSRPDDDAKSNSKALGEIELIMYGNDEKRVNDWNKIDLRILEQKKEENCFHQRYSERYYFLSDGRKEHRRWE